MIFPERSPISCSHPRRFASEDLEFGRLSVLGSIAITAHILAARCWVSTTEPYLTFKQNLEQEPQNDRFGCLFRV